MKRFISFLFPCLIASALVHAQQPLLTSTLQPPDRNIWDGVYTSASAAHGQQEYQRLCAGCHEEDLSGQGDAPALVGAPFFKRWQDLDVFDLYFAVEGQMYNFSNQNTLEFDFVYYKPEDVRDLTAYLLKMNGAPDGQELSPDFDALRRIEITAPKK